jgi:hypothetical protein
MDRPRCNTCPYWDQDEEELKLGKCLRRPPVLPPCDAVFAEWQEVDGNPYLGVQPETEYIDSCGEHPDYPEFIAALKSQR